jgi:hypothetical protein
VNFLLKTRRFFIINPHFAISHRGIEASRGLSEESSELPANFPRGA